jgi:hypothetical protein
MQHLAAYYESLITTGVLTKISAVPDQAIFTSDDDVRVPSGMANLIAEAGLSGGGTATYAQVQSPSLRQLANQDVDPIALAVKFSVENQLQWHGDNPRSLQASESVNFTINSNDSVAAANYGLIWLSDGAVSPTRGRIFTVRATAAAALVAGTWVNAAVVFDTSLPAGTYQVVGFRAESANLVAARIVFIGAAFRPGVIGDTGPSTNLMPYARNGNMGVFGQFNVDQPPTVDFLGVTDAAEVVVFDLIKSA